MLSIKAIVRFGLIAFFSMPMMIETFALPTDTDTDTGLAQTSSVLAPSYKRGLIAGVAPRILARGKYKKHHKKAKKRAKKYYKKHKKHRY